MHATSKTSTSSNLNFNINTSRSTSFGAFLLHGLVFCETEADALRHFNVPRRALFDARDFRFVHRLGSKAGHAPVETPRDQVIVHAV